MPIYKTDNLLERLYNKKESDEIIYTFLNNDEEREVLSYRSLESSARSVAALLNGKSWQGEPVLLIFPPGLKYIGAFFGCLYAGSIAVPLYPPRRRGVDRLLSVIQDSGATIALTTGSILKDLERSFEKYPALKALKWIDTDIIEADVQLEPYSPSLSDIAFLQYTSGSTSRPKGVMVSHGNLVHNLSSIEKFFSFSPGSCSVCWLPPYHDMGLIGGILQPLFSGIPTHLMAPVDFIRKPVRWLEEISRQRASTCGGPNFAYQLCVEKITPEEMKTLDLSCLELAFNGAEPIRPVTMERFSEKFKSCGFKKEAFYPCYGLAEGTLLVTGGRKGDGAFIRSFDSRGIEDKKVVPSEDGRQLTGCGRKLEDSLIAIVDPRTGNRCDEDRMGEIWIHSESVAKGYWNRPDLDDFSGMLDDQGPFFKTGDLGFFYEDQLFITGRLKELIIIRGRNHYPQDLEHTAATCHPLLLIDGGAAFSIDPNGEGVEELVIVQEAQRHSTQEELENMAEVIRGAIAEKHELTLHAVVLIRSMSIPKTSSGKIQRLECRELFLKGELNELYRDDGKGNTLLEEEPVENAPAENSLEFDLKCRLAEILDISLMKIEFHKPLTHLGIDSLKAVDFQHRIQEIWGAEIPMADILGGITLREIAQEIEKRGSLELLTKAAFPRTGTFPLSFGQQSLWFMERLAREKGAFNLTNGMRIKSSFDPERLLAAFRGLIKHYGSLRTVFRVEDEKPVQLVREQGELDFEIITLPSSEPEILNGILMEEGCRPFNLETGPLFRLRLIKPDNGDSIILFVVHHIVCDFWSLSLLTSGLGRLYRSLSGEVQEKKIDYPDFVEWQNGMLKGAKGLKAKEYWHKQLSGELPVMDLPLDFSRPAVQSFQGSDVSLTLSRELSLKLRELKDKEGVTMFTLLFAAFNTFLYRYTAQEDLIVGTPVAGRPGGTGKLFGYLVNLLPLRSAPLGEESFTEYLRKVNDLVIKGFAHQDYPFELLVEEIKPARDLSRSPVFQVVFSWQQTPASGDRSLAAMALKQEGVCFDVGGLSMETIRIPSSRSQFDITLSAGEVFDEAITFHLEYNTTLFKESTIKRMLGHLQNLLEGVVLAPQTPLNALPLLDTYERKVVLEDWNNTASSYNNKTTVSRIFESFAENLPEKRALIFKDEVLTYSELNRRANQLARFLAARGFEPGDTAAVCLERSPEILISLLAVMKCGGVYVPLDPHFPSERLAQVLEDIAPEYERGAVTIVTEEIKNRLSSYKADFICLDLLAEEIAATGDKNLNLPLDSLNTAYMIYTSGSTGRPKGVRISHRALVNFLESMRKRPGFTKEDILFSVTTLSFDIAGLELFLPVTSGGTVVIGAYETTLDGKMLSRRLKETSSSVMQATPATWRLLFEAGWEGDKSLKVLCGGEALTRELADQLAETCGEVWNMYGPTETTIWSTVEEIKKSSSPVYIGRPIDNTQVYILDKAFNPLPPGVGGELFIGGDGLAEGYYKRPDLTAEKFIQNPLFPSLSPYLYRTGDLVRYTESGDIEFLGRADNQVKVRGFRIELGDIESALNRHPGVQQGIVILKKSSAGDEYLAAYLVPEPGENPEGEDLRKFLKDILPGYMIPAAFVFLKEFPLTPNGKINRKALPDPAGGVSSGKGEYVAPSGSTEKWLAEIWSRVLGLEKVGVKDNFFDLGGHSLLMARVHNLILAKYPGDLSIVELFQYPTIRSLAQFLKNRGDESAPQAEERIQVRSEKNRSLNAMRNKRKQLRS